MRETATIRLTISQLIMGVMLACHAVLVAWVGSQNTPNSNEASHLVTGLHNWQFSRFDPYPVNPPLVRVLAAMPVLWAKPAVDWKDYQKLDLESECGERPEWSMGIGFVLNNLAQAKWFFAWARWMLIPLSVLGGYFCWRWAGELYGTSAGLAALVLWCFSPNVLAWSATICPDAASASLGVMAGFFFWRWLKLPDGLSALLAGIMLGLVLLTKMTWLILFAAWPVVWLFWIFAARSDNTGVSRRRQALQLTCILSLGLFVLNLGYGYEGTFTRLDDFTFASRTLAGDDSVVESGKGGNRFAESWLGRIPVPLPANYVRGIDIQKVDFEKGMPSYLFGQWKDHGWWYYYVVCAALKVPLGTWILGLLAMGVTIFGRRGSVKWLDEVALLLPAMVLLVFVSSQTGFSLYFRYVLPAFPFLIIWISQVACAAERRPRTIGVLVTGALTWMVASSLWVYPHNTSYFNEIAGGPNGGHRYLLHANLDWGQDIGYLRQWWERHPEAKPLYSLPRNSFADDLLTAGDETGLGTYLKTLTNGDVDEDAKTEVFVPKPGWYAVSVHRIHGPEGHFASFRQFQPVASAGYSILIYHVKMDEANRVRRKLGLAELSKEHEEETEECLIARLTESADKAEERSCKIKAAIFKMDGDDEHSTEELENILDMKPVCEWAHVGPSDIQAGIMNQYDLIIVPGGSGSEKATALGESGKQALRKFVRDGGGYIGICAGAFLATANYEWSLALVNARTITGMKNVPGQGIISMSERGVGAVKTELTDTGKRVLGDFPGLLDVRYSGGPILLPARIYDLPGYIPLAVFRTEVWKYEPQQGTMIDTPAILASSFGKGHVIIFSPHPETSDGLEPLVKRAILSVARSRGDSR